MEKIKEIDPIKEITLKVWREQISVTTGVAQLQALFDKRVEGMLEEIESRSHKQATNMLGISLSRQDWQALKSKYTGGE